MYKHGLLKLYVHHRVHRLKLHLVPLATAVKIPPQRTLRVERRQPQAQQEIQFYQQFRAIKKKLRQLLILNMKAIAVAGCKVCKMSIGEDRFTIFKCDFKLYKYFIK